MARPPVVKVTANFERNLDEIARFLAETDAAQAFDDLLATVIPNLERFPEIGRPFLRRQVRSVEVTHAVAALTGKPAALTSEPDALREYVLKHDLLLYAVIGGTIYLLAIRHQRQLSVDFAGHWER